MTVAYQGIAGAYSEAAAAALFPGETLQAHRTFADVYDLLRAHAKARIVAETVVRVRHCLVDVPGATLDDVRAARSHPQAPDPRHLSGRGDGARPGRLAATPI